MPPEDYWHIRDPFVSLAAAATVTTRLRLGTGICLVVEHDSISLAKTVATFDCLSNGRFLFGVGGGWNAEEMANHRTVFGRRWQVLRERILAMRAIWTEGQAAFHGEHVYFEPLSGLIRSLSRSRTRRSCWVSIRPMPASTMLYRMETWVSG